MRVPAGRRAGRGDLALFAGCILIALMALALPESWAAGLISALRSTLFRPVVMLQARATSDRMARFQLPLIEAARDSLSRVTQSLATVPQENAELRQLLQLSQRVTLPHVGAEVLHQSASTEARMLLIGIGTAEGVARFDPVVTADGLLGYIWEADAHTSSVLTWIHPEFRASAVTGGSLILGMVAPAQVSATQNLLELSGVALRDTIAVGATVYTSNLGHVYPRGIPIGKVIRIDRDSLKDERVYRVVPFVNPGSVSHVLVLKAEPGAGFLPIPEAPKKP